MIDFRQIWHTKALEDMKGFSAVVFVVEDDMQERAAEGHRGLEVVDGGVVETLSITDLTRECREGRVGAFVTVSQRR